MHDIYLHVCCFNPFHIPAFLPAFLSQMCRYFGLKHKPCPSVSDLPATGNGNWLRVARNPLRWLPQAIQQRRQERLVTSQLGYATTDAQNQASSY